MQQVLLWRTIVTFQIHTNSLLDWLKSELWFHPFRTVTSWLQIIYVESAECSKRKQYFQAVSPSSECVAAFACPLTSTDFPGSSAGKQHDADATWWACKCVLLSQSFSVLVSVLFHQDLPTESESRVSILSSKSRSGRIVKGLTPNKKKKKKYPGDYINTWFLELLCGIKRPPSSQRRVMATGRLQIINLLSAHTGETCSHVTSLQY